MLLYPLTVIVTLLFWGVFVDFAVRGLNDQLVWAAFGLALIGLIWVLHEGIRLALLRRS